MDQNVEVHNDIMRLIDRDIHPSSRNFEELKAAARICLNQATVDGCKSGFEICRALQDCGFIKIGYYDYLKQILHSAKLIRLQKDVEELELKIISPLNSMEPFDTYDGPAGAVPKREPVTDTPMQQPSTVPPPSAPTGPLMPQKNWPKIFRIIQDSAACKDWKTLARELEVSEPDIDAIVADNPLQLKEQCYTMLQKWVQLKSADATPKVLIEALKSMRCNKVADDVNNFVITLPLDN